VTFAVIGTGTTTLPLVDVLFDVVDVFKEVEEVFNDDVDVYNDVFNDVFNDETDDDEPDDDEPDDDAAASNTSVTIFICELFANLLFFCDKTENNEGVNR
jgi:hypothetical protein